MLDAISISYILATISFILVSFMVTVCYLYDRYCLMQERIAESENNDN